MKAVFRNFQKISSDISIIVFLLLSALVLYSFITAPFTGDIQVFMAAANQVKYKNASGLLGIFEAWELKGIANRCLMYIIYLVADVIVGYENKILFEVVAKLAYSVLIILILAISTLLLPIKKHDRKRYFFTFFLVVFATFTACQMQAEMTCIVLAILIMSCLLRGGRGAMLLAGIIGATLLFFKSIFFLLFFMIIMGANVYDAERNKPKAYILSIGSMMFFEIMFLVIVYLIYPQEFIDMGNASEFQTTLFSTGSNVLLGEKILVFIGGFIQACMAIPFLLIGAISALILFFEKISKKQWMSIMQICVCWLIPVDIIIVSNTYFLYHYFLLVFPGIVSILTLIRSNDLQLKRSLLLGSATAVLLSLVCWLFKDGLEQISIINYSTLKLTVAHLVVFAIAVHCIEDFYKLRLLSWFLTFTVCAFFEINYSSAIAPKYQNIRENHIKTAEICKTIFPDDFGDEDVLFLDSGVVSYWKDAPSYSRYFFNLPMNRWQPGKEWEIQQEEYKNMLNYTGKYIVYSSWLGTDKYPKLEAKIESEYERLPDGGLCEDSPDWNMFELFMPPNLEDVKKNSELYLLRRKE